MGVYIFSFLFALQLVIGQVFWKLAVDNNKFELTTEYLFSKKGVGFATSPYLMLGILFYLSATMLNFWLLTRYQFTTIQAIAIPATLILVLLAGAWIFKDQISFINVLGMGVIIIGVVLATVR